MDDVIVVGAGPAGNNTALGLATRGYTVTVIDWRQNIGDKLCSGILGKECTTRYPPDPALVYRDARSASVLAPAAAKIHFETAVPQAQVVDRVAYVASFAHQAQAAGATYLLGQRVLRVIREQQSVTVTTEQGQHHARALVLAAGFGSSLTRQIGLGSVPDHVAGIQAVVATKDVDDIEVYLGHDLAPGFFCWLVPTLPQRALVGLLARRGAQTHLARFLQLLRSEGKVTDIVKEATCWGIPLRPLKRTYQDRVLVVGDAAGQVKPTTGGGIYYSLLASEIAADVLGGALAMDALSAKTLSQYQTRWQALLSRELETGYSARRLCEFLTDQQISSLVRKAASNGVHTQLVNPSETSFDWHSRMIAIVMANPILGRALRLINPLLARFAYQPGDTFSTPPANPIDSSAKTAS